MFSMISSSDTTYSSSACSDIILRGRWREREKEREGDGGKGRGREMEQEYANHRDLTH